MSTEPFAAKQDVFGIAKEVREKGALLFATVAEALEVQPFAPVTVTL
jgi:hypothetical protein